jgi:hypothetical protein
MIAKEVSLRFFDRQPSVQAKVEIELEEFDPANPPPRLRGRILEIGGSKVDSDLRIQPGNHTLWFAEPRCGYRVAMIQTGAAWFDAKLVTPRPPTLGSRIRASLGF